MRNVVVGLAGAAILAVGAAACGNAEPPGWTPEMRDAFLQNCATANRGRPLADVKHYCECTLGRLEASMTLAEYRAEETAIVAGNRTPSPRVTAIALGCMGVDPTAADPDAALAWTPDEQRRFLVGCIPTAKTQLGADERAGDKAARYCRCALAEAAGRMTADEYRKLERAAGSTTPSSGALRDIATACAATL